MVVVVIIGGVIKGKDEDFVTRMWSAFVARNRTVFEFSFGSFFLVIGFGVAFVVDDRCWRVVIWSES